MLNNQQRESNMFKVTVHSTITQSRIFKSRTMAEKFHALMRGRYRRLVVTLESLCLLLMLVCSTAAAADHHLANGVTVIDAIVIEPLPTFTEAMTAEEWRLWALAENQKAVERSLAENAAGQHREDTKR
jgi:hypothetical protein